MRVYMLGYVLYEKYAVYVRDVCYVWYVCVYACKYVFYARLCFLFT